MSAFVTSTQLSRVRLLLSLVLASAVMAAAAVTADRADAQEFGVAAFDGQVTASSAGDPYTQAGGHPYSAWTQIDFNAVLDPDLGIPTAPEDPKTISVDLPAGFIGNPDGIPQCPVEDFLLRVSAGGSCPRDTMVGQVRVKIFGSELQYPVYNLVSQPDKPATLGMVVILTPVIGTASVRSDGDYGVSLNFDDTNQTLELTGVGMELWGVPADPVHDVDRGGPSIAPRKPFITLPTSCTPSGVGLETKLRIDSWQDPGDFKQASFYSHLPPAYPATPDSWGAQQGPTGCEDLPFEPKLTAQPVSRQAGAPTGLDVTLSVPQEGLASPDGLASAHLKRAEVALPEGMTVNPSSADGLGACAPAQVGLGDDSVARCPDSSKIGTVEIDTPLLDEPMAGSVFLAEQGNNPFNSLLSLYIYAEGPGVVIKLPGKVTPDPVTGRLTAVFDDNPQLPFGEMRIRFRGGSRAPLVNPSACGSYTTVAKLSSWAMPDEQVVLTDELRIDGGCSPQGFAPGFEAGTTGPIAGAFSPFVTRITRDGANQKELGRLDVSLPKGLVAKLKGVPLCSNAQAAAAAGRPGRASQGSSTCPAGSQIGTTTVGAGAGPDPYYPRIPGGDVSGRVFLTEGYRGAPYGLAIEVPAVAGPFDLGTVMVRAAIQVDPETAELTVVSDRLPRILEGIPLDVRDVRVVVDRPNFTINPTSCEPMRVRADIRAQDDTGAVRESRFQVGDCDARSFSPKLAMRVTGKRQMKTGRHPGLRAVLTQGGGQANVDSVMVTLPKSIVLDPTNTNDPKLVCDYDRSLKADCPASSIVGTATAATPVLNKPLTGPVHLVQGIKFGPTGNRIRTTPSLLVKLRGDVAINLRARTTSKGGRLVTVFRAVPDAPVSKFTMHVKGGRKGILVVTRTKRAKLNLCRGKHVASVRANGQNGKRRSFATRLKTPCAAAAKRGR